jgi:hypothetical protein
MHISWMRSATSLNLLMAALETFLAMVRVCCIYRVAILRTCRLKPRCVCVLASLFYVSGYQSAICWLSSPTNTLNKPVTVRASS